MRSIRGFLDDISTAFDENQEIAAFIGSISGVALAVSIERYGAEPDPATFAITVTQARASLLSALALVFTGLSIVLALTALTAGNMATKFSPRLLRMRLRGGGDKWVLAVFALTGSFILASQVLLRNRAGDTIAPPLLMSVSVVLLVLTSVMIIWYINGTLQSMRVDYAIQWIGRKILKAGRRHAYAVRRDVVVDAVDLERPPTAVDLLGPDSGYVTCIDTDELARLSRSRHARVFIAAGTGRPVLPEEPIGWVAAPSPLDERELADITDCLTISTSRDPDDDVAYVIGVLVDIALMALSPAVNDPRTGVDVVELLAAIWADSPRWNLGVRTRTESEGPPDVIVEEMTIGDILDGAGRQILLYGSGDRTVTAALVRLGQQGQRVATSERDRTLARAFTAEVESVRGPESVSDGLKW